MIHLYLALKLVHVLGAAVLFGTGLGIAFFMWMAHRSGDAAFVARTARVVVIADLAFTATAVVIQPLSGVGLMLVVGYPFDTPWLVAAMVLYVVTGLCWMPVVVIQMRMRDLAARAVREGAPLPAEYQRLFRRWFRLGWPAFAAVILIFADMIWKPALW